MRVTADDVRTCASEGPGAAIVRLDDATVVVQLDSEPVQRALREGRATVLVSHHEVMAHLSATGMDAERAAELIGERE